MSPHPRSRPARRPPTAERPSGDGRQPVERRSAAAAGGARGDVPDRRAVPDRDERRRRKRQALLEVAVSVVRRDGPDASMERIATEAGVTKPILYRVFGDRAGLQRAVGEHAFEALAAELAAAMGGSDRASPRALVERAVDAALGFVEREPALTALLPVAGGPTNGGPVAGPDAALPVVALLGEALRGLGGDSGAAEPWAYAVMGMVVWAGGWWAGRPTMPRAALVGYLTDLVCGGVPG